MGAKSRMKKIRRREEEIRKVHGMKIVEVESNMKHARRFLMGECNIYLAREKTEGGFPAWHLSISCKDRYPTWDEMLRARHDIMPANIDVVMFLPSKKESVEINNNCFHFWQVQFTGEKE